MTTATIRLSLPRSAAPVRSTAAVSWSTIELWHARARQRRQLAGLTPEQLRDIGISAEAARVEAAKPFWRD